MSIKMTQHMFKYGTMKYFRGNAHRVELGDYGKKRDPIGPKAYLVPEGNIRRGLLARHVERQGPFSVDWSKVSSKDFGANLGINYMGVNASSTHALTLSRARSADLQLLNLAIDTGAMEDILNNANRARADIFDEGGDARVVSEVWIVVEAELADAVRRGGQHGLSVSAAGQSLELSFGGSSRSAQTVTLPPKSTFAYAMAKVSDWNRRRELVEDVDIDYKGMA